MLAQGPSEPARKVRVLTVLPSTMPTIAVWHARRAFRNTTASSGSVVLAIVISWMSIQPVAARHAPFMERRATWALALATMGWVDRGLVLEISMSTTSKEFWESCGGIAGLYSCFLLVLHVKMFGRCRGPLRRLCTTACHHHCPITLHYIYV